MRHSKQVVQAILFAVFFTVFMKSGSPFVVLVLFLLLCGHSLNLFFYIYNREASVASEAEAYSWPQVLIAVSLQLLSLLVLALLVWLFITRKLQVFGEVWLSAGIV